MWRRFRSQPGGRQALMLEAAFWLVTAKVCLVTVPFSWIARHLGGMHAPGSRDSDPDGQGPCHPAIAREIGWAIERAAYALPFRVVCLPRGLAAWKMLRRRQVAALLHFGATRPKEATGLLMHAWVDSCGVQVCGYPEALDYVEIGCFRTPFERHLDPGPVDSTRLSA